MQCIFSEFLGIDLSQCCLAVVIISFSINVKMQSHSFAK